MRHKRFDLVFAEFCQSTAPPFVQNFFLPEAILCAFIVHKLAFVKQPACLRSEIFISFRLCESPGNAARVSEHPHETITAQDGLNWELSVFVRRWKNLRRTRARWTVPFAFPENEIREEEDCSSLQKPRQEIALRCLDLRRRGHGSGTIHLRNDPH